MTVTPTMTAVPLTITELETLASAGVREIGAAAEAAWVPPGTDIATIGARLDALVPQIARLKIILTALDEARSCRREPA